EILEKFTYYNEEDNQAYTMQVLLSQDEKQAHANHLMEVQAQNSYKLNQKKIGQTYKVLIDKKENGHFVGRTEFDSVDVDNEVLIDASLQYCRIGDFVQVRITDAREFDLYGEVIG